MSLRKPIRRIAVVGTGAVGASWTSLYLARGFDVVATDPAPDAEATLRRHVDAAWTALTVLGLSPKASPEHLDFTMSVREAVFDADFIQENGPEREDRKIELLGAIDDGAPHDSIIASSSSVVMMSVMQAACQHPERCVIGHCSNPAHINPLVEVVGGARTGDDAIARTMAFYRSIGKKPIHVRKEVKGHATQRLQAALYREIAHLIADGVLNVADADAAVYWGVGLRWAAIGPSLEFHLAGGADGIRHFVEHLGQTTSALDELERPAAVPAAVQNLIVDAVLREAGDRSLQQLAHHRDEALLDLLRGRTTDRRVSPGIHRRIPRIRRRP
jgi:3-hydroxyacyl-CoA dehydrogenase